MLKVDAANVEVVPEYEAQFTAELKFEGLLITAQDTWYAEFGEQPWVQALVARRVADNQARVPFDGRTYNVTETQLRQVQRLFPGDRYLGYNLALISEEQYMRENF